MKVINTKEIEMRLAKSFNDVKPLQTYTPKRKIKHERVTAVISFNSLELVVSVLTEDSFRTPKQMDIAKFVRVVTFQGLSYIF